MAPRLSRNRLPTSTAAAVILALTVGLAAGGCGDGAVEPEEVVTGLSAPDSVVLDAVRDTVRLTAALVYSSGRTFTATGVSWSGCGAGVAELSPEGLLRTVGSGECEAVAAWGSYRDTVAVAVRREGVITLTFDDGWKSARTVALPILEDAGLVGNVAVVPGTAGWPAFLTLEDMRDLDAAGWSFVSHTMSHDSLTTLAPDTLIQEITEPVRWLRDAGLRTGDVFIVPYNDWGPRELEAIRSVFAAARGYTVAYFWPEFMAEWRPEDPYRLTSIDGSTLSRTAAGRDEVMAYVEQAISEGRMLDILFHDITPEDEAGFRALAQALAAHRDRVRTWSELFPLEGP